jgi:CheY-like chemotaxis protein
MPKILVVEDDKTLREVYVTILSLAKYDVGSAANGQLALEKCKKKTYDIILLDLMMPVLDGVGFLRQAQLETTAPATKVIIFSNLSSGSSLEEALQLGTTDHILKSHLTPKSLVALIERHTAA